MPENQNRIINNHSDFKNIIRESRYHHENRLSDYTINLSYFDFINALSDIDEIELSNCTLSISCGSNNDYENDIRFKCKLTFSFCTFISDFALDCLLIYKCINFEYCTLKNLTFINLSTSKSNKIFISIIECIIDGYISLFFIDDNIEFDLIGNYENINKDYCNFPITIHNKSSFSLLYENKTISFNESYRYNNYNIEFYKCHFIEDLYFNNKGKNHFTFNHCTFNKYVCFKNTEIEIIKIYKSTFKQKLLFYDVIFNNLDIINCSFEDTVKITYINNLVSDINIKHSTIKGMFYFNSFGDNNEITMKENSSNVSFKHIFVEPTGYLIIRKIKNGNFIFDYANVLGQIVMQELNIDSLQMHNASIIGSLIMQDIKVKELDLKNTSLIGKLVFNPSDTLNIFDSNIIQNRETAYLLKKGKQEEGDSISASHFKRKELQLYLKDCTSNFNPNKVKECIVLFFNKISNDFGQSWVRGIIFTMSFAYIFYLLINFYGLEKPIFRFAWSLEGFGTAWKEYLKILNVLNFNDKLDNFKFTPLGETLFFVSKIFVSYGIYQTVSAFRKFGK